MISTDDRSRDIARAEKKRRRRVPATVCRRCGIRVRWHQIRCPFCDRFPRAFWIGVTAISIAAAILIAIDLLFG